MKQTLFKVHIEGTDIVPVSLLQTLTIFGHIICSEFKNIQYIQRYKIE